MDIIDKTFMVCVRFLMALGRFTHLTYKQISVIFNLWIQGIVLLLASITPLAISICKDDNIVIISMLAVYSFVCTYTIIRILRHYMLPLEETFDLCVADLLRISARWKRSYNYVNIALFVVLYLVLIVFDTVLTYVLYK